MAGVCAVSENNGSSDLFEDSLYVCDSTHHDTIALGSSSLSCDVGSSECSCDSSFSETYLSSDSNSTDDSYVSVVGNSSISGSLYDDTLLSDDALFKDADSFRNIVSSKEESSSSKRLGSANNAKSSAIKSSNKNTPQKILIPDNSSLTSAYIQDIINNAQSGSTIEFTGSFYKNLFLTINKPLNIISKSSTVINMSYDLPVFTISNGGSGTNISGFIINCPGSFVEAYDVSNIAITKNSISTKKTAIIVKNVYDSKIQKNNFLSFKTGIDISKSGGIVISYNNITPNNGYNTGIILKDTGDGGKISILHNNITGHDRRIDSTGIYFGENARNVLLQGNIINEWYTAINFPKSVNGVSIINNTLNHNGDGVIINGWISNFTFNKNVVTNTGRVGVLFDDDFQGTKGNFVLEKNYFTASGQLDMRNTGNAAVNIGENFAKRRCVRVVMKYGLSIKTRQNGNGYYFSVVDRNGRAVSGLPNFSARFTINGVSYNVLFIDSVAYLNTGGSGAGSGLDGVLDVGEDKRQLSEWGQTQTVSSDDFEYYKNIYDELVKALNRSPDDVNKNNNANNTQRTTKDNGTESSSGSGNGGGDSGISDGSSSLNSNSQSAASSGSSDVSASSASPSASSALQAEAPESAAAKSLLVDEETFRVAGVGGLVFLIICVIGLYYREDILEMLKED